MSKIFSTKFTSSTRRTVTKVISVMLVAVIALLGAGRPANAQPNQSPRDYAICGMTDANGRFSLPTGGARISFAFVAAQHKNGNWHRLERSKDVDNNFWWNDQAVAGWITSSDFTNRPVCAQVFTGLTTRPGGTYLLTGKTDSKGRFSIPTGGAQISLALVAVQHKNGNWHTVEQSRYVDNNFWWNDGAVAGWITSSAFANRTARALVFTGGWDITGQTDNNGSFSLSLPWPIGVGCLPSGGSDGYEQRLAFAAVAIRHKNGNWHTVEQSRYVNNNFWWNNKAVAGRITSSEFANRSIRVLLFVKGRVCIG